MKAVILAGGFGSRLSEATNLIPKPMVEIGGKPILWHIMKIYSYYGINEFIICCGYKQYVIKEYFAVGEEAKFARHKRVFEAIHKGLQELGLQYAIKREWQSGLVVSVLFPSPSGFSRNDFTIFVSLDISNKPNFP
jgi:NDP-sugar pyrophosphorylase family protein